MRKSQLTKVPFHKVHTNTLISGMFNITLQPAVMNTRLGVVADAFEEYRLTSLRFRLHRSGAAIGPQAACFYPGVVDTLPNTVTDVAEVVHSTVVSQSATVPSAWVMVPRAVLSGPFNWYKSLASSLDTSEEQQGVIAIAGTGTDSFLLEVSGTYEFRGSAATVNTPMLLEATRLRQRNKLLSILATPAPAAGSSKGTPNGSGSK